MICFGPHLLVGSESLRNRSWTTSGDHAELVGVMGVEFVCVVFIIMQSTTEKLPALAAPKALTSVSSLPFIHCFLSSPAIFATNLPKLARTIDNTILVIQFIDVMEEARDLDLQEWNFKKLVQNHLNTLLEWQRIYWKQRGQIKWVTCVEAGTKFFHSNATIIHRQNLITTIEDIEGNLKCGHDDKAKLLWEAYKYRLGTLNFSTCILTFTIF
jgi:hypothetical protein